LFQSMTTLAREIRKNNAIDKNKKRLQQYYLNNLAEIKQNQHQYRINNKEAIKHRLKEYYLKHKESIRGHQRQYCRNNREEIRLRKKRYWLKNKELINIYQREYVHKKKIQRQQFPIKINAMKVRKLHNLSVGRITDRNQYTHRIKAPLKEQMKQNIKKAKYRLPCKTKARKAIWKNKTILQHWFISASEKLGVDDPMDWYRISWTKFIEIGGRGCLRSFKSLGYALQYAYPKLDWDLLHFSFKGKKSGQWWLCNTLKQILPGNTEIVEDYMLVSVTVIN